MKRLTLIILSILSFTMLTVAQNNVARPKVAILNLDTKGFAFDPVQAGNITRLELDKLDLFDVMDRYDIDYLLDKDSQTATNCYGKLCLIEIAKKIKAEKMMTGTIELLSERVVITLRMIDVASGSIEKTQVLDFLNIKNQVQTMIGITLKKMYKLPYDETVYNQLTKIDAFDSSVNVPNDEKVNLNGPRMGVAFFSGDNAKILKSKENVGGYEMVPVVFQFGYQLEVQYIGQGNFQALVEFLPMITGLDQGKVIPSFTILNGLRDNRLGLEFAFGPNFLLTRKASGYHDSEGAWHLESEWDTKLNGKNPNSIEKRTDSRGDYTLATGFIFAFGKTFRSGRLNIPVNAYVRPNYKDGSQYGISFGFNARTHKKRG
jgi:hypothetical protein